MTSKFHKLLFSLTVILMSVAVLVSCKKDSVENSGLVELFSFGPTGAKHGDTLRFIGSNLNKVTSIKFTGGTGATIEQSAFKKQTSELILVIVPPAAEKGFVTLKTPDAEIVTKTQLNLGVTTIVTSMNAQARPGSNITINGSYLNWVEKIIFPRDKIVQTFVSKSFNQLVVKVPDDAETGPLILFYSGTDSSNFQTRDTLKVTLPLATSLSPNPILHQTNLTITGTDLDLTKQLFFTGVSTAVTSFVSQTATQIVVRVPAGARKGRLTLVAASGISTLSIPELDVILPAVTTMTPNPIDPGANITVTGTRLDLVTSITFGNAPAVTSFISSSATQIVVRVPLGVLRGKIILGVLNSTLTVQSTDILEIKGSVPPPVISFPIYNDAVTSNWNGWIGGGWGGTSDRNNTTPVREGTRSVRINYVGGWGSPFQLGGASINLAPFTTFKISVYGGPGSSGKRINIGINASDKHTITIVEGAWTDYSILISTFGVSTLNEIWVKEYSGTGGFTVYVDAMGLN